MADWLGSGHLAWFVIELVGRVDTSAFHAGRRTGGVGRAGYDPDMLLTLIVYAYCTGVRSSRVIERLCEVDVAYRVIAGNRVPDHSTISRFVADHTDAVSGLFTQVLVLSAKAGLGRVGVVAVDGTKMAADAALRATRPVQALREEMAALAGQVVAEHRAVDVEQDALFGSRRGDELPPELADPNSRAARLAEAVRQVEAEQARLAEVDADRARSREQQRAAGRAARGPGGPADQVAGAQARLKAATARRDARRAAEAAARARHGGKLPGSAPDLDTPVAQAEAALQAAREQAAREQAGQRPAEQDVAQPGPLAARKGNSTDPDSRVMKRPGGFVQGFNCQAAATADQIVIAADVTQDNNDAGQAQPMMTALTEALTTMGLPEPGVVLFDAGYLSNDNLTAPGPERLIACQAGRHQRRSADPEPLPQPAPDADPLTRMRYQLSTPQGSALYAHRSHTIEPVFGMVKEARGFRKFQRRGIAAVRAEWKLITLTHNVLKMHRAQRYAEA